MIRAEQFSEADSLAIALLVDELARAAGMQVAVVGFRDEQGRLALTYAPGFEAAVCEYLATVNWNSALLVVKEHFVDGE